MRLAVGHQLIELFRERGLAFFRSPNGVERHIAGMGMPQRLNEHLRDVSSTDTSPRPHPQVSLADPRRSIGIGSITEDPGVDDGVIQSALPDLLLGPPSPLQSIPFDQ